MTPENFCYWLNGFVELTSGQPPTPEQWKSICAHLTLAFHKVTPPVHQVLQRAVPSTTIPEFPPRTGLPPGFPGVVLCHEGQCAQTSQAAPSLIIC